MEEEVESGAEQVFCFCFVWSNGKASLSPRSLCSFSPPSDPPGRSVRYRTTPAPKREAEARWVSGRKKRPPLFLSTQFNLTLASFSPSPFASASALFFAETRSNFEPSATPRAEWASARLICGAEDWAGEGDASEGSGEEDDEEEAALAKTSRRRRRCSRRGTAANDDEGADVDAGPQPPLEGQHGCKLVRRIVLAASMVGGRERRVYTTRGKERSSGNGRKEEVRFR